jgi:hypothetical protein
MSFFMLQGTAARNSQRRAAVPPCQQPRYLLRRSMNFAPILSNQSSSGSVAT